jgi:hypothetical protein
MKSPHEPVLPQKYLLFPTIRIKSLIDLTTDISPNQVTKNMRYLLTILPGKLAAITNRVYTLYDRA